MKVFIRWVVSENYKQRPENWKSSLISTHNISFDVFAYFYDYLLVLCVFFWSVLFRLIWMPFCAQHFCARCVSAWLWDCDNDEPKGNIFSVLHSKYMRNTEASSSFRLPQLLSIAADVAGGVFSSIVLCSIFSSKFLFVWFAYGQRINQAIFYPHRHKHIDTAFLLSMKNVSMYT